MALALDKPLQATVGRMYPQAPQPPGLQVPLKPHQLAMLQRCLDIEKVAVMSPYKMGFMADPVSSGKCMGKGTELLMYSGDVKKVEDVVVGDLLMGDDSTPRKVLALGRGQDEMFQIRPMRSSPYTVNSEHILCLQGTDNGAVRRNSGTGTPYLKFYDVSGKIHYISFPTEELAREAFLAVNTDGVSCMTVRDLLALPKMRRQDYKAYRTAVDFCSQRIDLDPYVLGARLGARKRIPQEYKANSRDVRLAVLAGLLDTDGYLDQKQQCYEITQKGEELATDIVFLARSLGFAASCTYLGKKRTGTYHVVHISGDGLHDIPVKLTWKKAAYCKRRTDCLRYGFDIEPLGRGDYYGFELDGNHRYVLGDLTVTHNTAVSVAMPYAEKVMYRRSALNVIVVPQNICMQWMAEIKKFTGDDLRTLLLIDYSSIADLEFEPAKVSAYDIILTTPMYFSTLASFCQRGQVTPRRVIIDEADTIANMVTKKIPGAMTWFVSATMDRLPESQSGMVQVGKEVRAVEDMQAPFHAKSALSTARGGTLRAEETGTYEIPARLLRSGERICRCEADWTTESFGIPAPISKDVVVANVIIEVLALLTEGGMLKARQLESANARDFRNLQTGTTDEFRILPALLAHYRTRQQDAQVCLEGLRGKMHMEERLNQCREEVRKCGDYMALIRQQAAGHLLCQGTFEQLALPDRDSDPVRVCHKCPHCDGAYSELYVRSHEGDACLKCGGDGGALEVRDPGKPALADSKVTKLVELIEGLQPKPRVIVFAKYTQAFGDIKRQLDHTGLVVKEADAGTAAAAERMIADFKEGRVDVLLAESSLFCSGMNLPEVTDVCFLHAVHAYSTKQIAGRAQRPGRKAPCRIHTFLHFNETAR